MRGILAIALAVLASQALTGSAPDHFAYGYAIELDGDAPVYEIELPAEVYRGVVRGDLGDLRVFNAAGEPVPYLLRDTPAGRTGARLVDVPVFPLFSAPGRTGADISVQVDTRDDGAVVRVRRDPSAAAVPAGYLIDASAIEEPIDVLRLRLADGEGDRVAQLRVEASRDLSAWRAVGAPATVARLAYGEHRLQQTTIEVPGVRERYLRLRWLDPAAHFELAGVEAEVRTAAAEPARQWVEVEGRRGEGRVHEFDTGGRFPVDRLRLDLPANALVAASVSSRASEAEPWQPRHRGLHYHLRVEGAELTGEPAPLPMVRDRFWRVELGEGGYTGAVPTLRLGWRAQRLAFLAAGEAPFLLAYGSADVGPAAAPLDGVLATLGTRHGAALLRPARIGTAVPLGGADRLTPSPTPLDWRRLLLWGVLLTGVAVLATMAWRLRAELARPEPGGPAG